MKILVNGESCTEIIRYKMNKEDIISSAENLLEELKKSPIKYQKLTIMLALVLPASTLNVYGNSEIIQIGYVFWDILKDVAYVICLLGASIEATKCVLGGTVDSLGKIGIKYLAFALLFKFLPRIVAKIFTM